MQIEAWMRVCQWRELPKAGASRNLKNKVLAPGKFWGNQSETWLTSLKSKIYTGPRVSRNICWSQSIVL